MPEQNPIHLEELALWYGTNIATTDLGLQVTTLVFRTLGTIFSANLNTLFLVLFFDATSLTCTYVHAHIQMLLPPTS
jgi:hypothetical protein